MSHDAFLLTGLEGEDVPDDVEPFTSASGDSMTPTAILPLKYNTPDGYHEIDLEFSVVPELTIDVIIGRDIMGKFHLLGLTPGDDDDDDGDVNLILLGTKTDG